MLNNRIIVTGVGLLDARELTDEQWAELCERNSPSTRAQHVKCAVCWNNYGRTRWMRTYDMTGVRTVSHQPGEGDNHPYQALETPEHRAYNERVARVGESAGFDVLREATAHDGATRADVLLRGDFEVDFEHQHSPFQKGRGATERTRLTLAGGRDYVLWHTDKRRIASAARVPMVRSDELPAKVISQPNYRIEFRSGYRRIHMWKCTARDGHLCPDRRMTGCGQTHATSQPSALALDDMIRQAPAGLLLPIQTEGVVGPASFYTDRESYRRYEEWSGKDGGLVLDGRPAERRGLSVGQRHGHSAVAASGSPSGRPTIWLTSGRLLDWRDPKHNARHPGPCRICGNTTRLLDDDGVHAHKVCVEEQLQNH